LEIFLTRVDIDYGEVGVLVMLGLGGVQQDLALAWF